MALSPLGIAMMMQPPQAQARPGSVAPTDWAGIYNAAQQAANTQYGLKLGQQNAMWGGLAGLGSAGVIAAPSLWKLAQGGAAAATPAAGTAAPVVNGTWWGTSNAGIPGLGGSSLWGAPGAAAGADTVAADLGATAAPTVAADLAAPAVADAAATAAPGWLADAAAFLPMLFGIPA